MRVEHLKSFIAVYEEGTFTKASRRLFIAQPVITKHISLLESDLGVTLFTRTTRKVVATPEGDCFYRIACETVEHLDRGIESIRTMSSLQDCSMRIGYNYLYMDDLTTRWLMEFKDASSPAPIITIMEEDPESLLFQVSEGIIDCAFIGIIDRQMIPSDLDYVSLGSVGEKIIVGERHCLARRKSVCLDDIIGETFVYPFREPSSMLSIVKKELEENDRYVKVFHIEHDASALKMVELSNMIIDLPSDTYVPSGHVVEIPYRSKHAMHKCFIWSRECKNPHVGYFADLVRSKVKDGPIVFGRADSPSEKSHEVDCEQ